MIKFSVIIPTYNRAATIARTLESVVRQTYENWELIIVDDGSKDTTPRVVEPFLDDERIQYFRRENQGVSAARNYGASIAVGSILAFLDSDDEVDSCWLQDFEKLRLSANRKLGYASCGYVLLGKDYPPRGGRRFSTAPYLCAPAGAFVLSKDVFDAVGGYDSMLRQSENWEMAARALTYCGEQDYAVAHTNKCNIVWHLEKTQSQLRERDFDRALAYLRLHEKYANGGVLQYSCHRFLLGAAVNFARAGHIAESRTWFYQSFWKYPSLKGLARIFCFEIPFLRKRIWQNRKFLIDITET